MRSIGIVTTARSDYGILRPVIARLQAESSLDVRLFVSGMHLSRDFGHTIDAIESDGFRIEDRIDMLIASDSPQSIAKSMGIGTLGFAQAYARWRPDFLVVIGDRFEMHAAVVAALPFKIPVAHLHGGEVTEGAIDEAFRHSITKMSHLHFVAAEEYANRVIQMGEAPWRITISGAPALDHLNAFSPLTIETLSGRIGMSLQDRGFLLITYHPVTLEFERTAAQIDQLLAALDSIGVPAVFTMPNADTSGRLIREKLLAFTRHRSDAVCVESLGLQGYFSMMTYAAAMVGNSSSGLIEAPSFKLPVVNIGNRQKGRIRAANVLDCPDDAESITATVRRALTEAFRASLKGLTNPLGDGKASDRIARRLMTEPLDDRLLSKSFYDLPIQESEPR